MTAICEGCGRDCRTKLALSKHEIKCMGKPKESVQFLNRHHKTGEKCSICRDVFSDLGVIDANTLFCLACGCVFKTKKFREDVLGRIAEARAAG